MLAEPPSKESDRADIDKIINGLEQARVAVNHLLDGHHKDIRLHVIATLSMIDMEARNVGKYILDRFSDGR